MALKSSNKKGKILYRIISIILLIGLLSLLYWFIYGSIWQIKKIDILNAKHTDIQSLKSDIDNFLHKKKFLIIPNDHMIFLSKTELRDFILNTYPSVEEVIISKNFDKEIVINIKDRKAMGVWCDENCFFFDDLGILFKKSFDYTGAVFTTWSMIKSNSLRFYDKALCIDMCIDEKFVNFLSKNKIKKVIINGEDLKMETEYGFYIKALNNASTTMLNMNLFKNKYEGDLKSLKYLDLRFGDKIFYK